MKYIGYLEMEKSGVGRFMKKIIESDDLLIVFKTLWDQANKEYEVGEIHAEIEPAVYQHVVTIVPVGYLGSVKVHV